MQSDELNFQNLTTEILKSYKARAATDSAQFLRWFLENIFRLDQQDADDAAVDAKQDKGIDGLYVNDTTETIHLIQSKVKQKAGSTLGDTDLKEFVGSLQQFKTPQSVEHLLQGDANDYVKNAITRSKLLDKLKSGYRIEGVFCTNICANKDAKDYISSCGEDIALYDSERISREFVDLSANEGVAGEFFFNVSDTNVIRYDTSDTVKARIFLADALQLTHLSGIQDGKLFEKNVRLSLGNTKINRSLISSMRDKHEHKNFPLYHNGITILCEEFVKDDDQQLGLRNYVVVNGAQSISSLFTTKSKLSSDLRLLVKAVEVKDDAALADKITTNSNNQNAIKPRDMRSNHGIQQRLKSEIESISSGDVSYEVKRGEKSGGKVVISNEDAGLILLAMDLGQPWLCHQRYKVMDDSHSEIFGRPDVTGWKILGLISLFNRLDEALAKLDDQTFANYTLTRYFLTYSVAEIIKDSAVGRLSFQRFDHLIGDDRLADFQNIFAQIAMTTADDLNAEIEDEKQDSVFDYKAQLKSPNWCRSTAGKLKAQYKKDVSRKKADAIDDLLKPLGIV